MALPAILGQAAPSRPSPQTFLAHQPLDAMQTGVEPFGQHVVPDPTGAIGAIASGKAGPDPSDEHLVILSPSAR